MACRPTHLDWQLPLPAFLRGWQKQWFADERHLWPAFHWLIEQCRPAVVVGEQVASAAVGPWIDLVLTDLEALGYAGGAYAGPAAGVGAPHIRDRSYWVGYSSGARSATGLSAAPRRHKGVARVAHDARGELSCTRLGSTARGSGVDGLADPGSKRLDGFDPLLQWHGARRIQGPGVEADGRGPVAGFWRSADWLRCRDDRWRPVESGTFPLAHGVPARVGRLRGYGNAIVPQQAAQFIQALMEYQPCSPN